MHSELTLRIRKDVVIVEPAVGSESAPALQFQRASGEMALVDRLPPLKSTEETIPIYGVLGTVRFLA
ncbi:hypothetical protein H4R34_005363, partial [Dimargaris verticillata]